MTPPPDRSPTSRWLEYFEGRRGRPLAAALDAPFVPSPGSHALARSIARFELGESGDGERIRRLAAAAGDAPYARSIELFVQEEQQHARWLQTLRERFGGRRLESHWSDSAFVVLRHAGGLRREICVLLTAELVALSYYRVLVLACDDELLRATCRRILLDERGHVAFHRATLGRECARMSAPARAAAMLAWRAFSAITASVVAWDHREVLELAGVSRRDFERDVRADARRLARAVRHAGAAGPRHGASGNSRSCDGQPAGVSTAPASTDAQLIAAGPDAVIAHQQIVDELPPAAGSARWARGRR